MSILIGLPVQRVLGACHPKRNQRHLRDPPTFSWELSRLLSNFRAKNAHLNWWQQLTPAHLKIPHPWFCIIPKNSRRLTIAWLAKLLPPPPRRKNLFESKKQRLLTNFLQLGRILGKLVKKWQRHWEDGIKRYTRITKFILPALSAKMLWERSGLQVTWYCTHW